MNKGGEEEDDGGEEDEEDDKDDGRRDFRLILVCAVERGGWAVQRTLAA